MVNEDNWLALCDCIRTGCFGLNPSLQAGGGCQASRPTLHPGIVSSLWVQRCPEGHFYLFIWISIQKFYIYNWFTMLCQFQVYNKVIQYIYLFFSNSFSIYYRIMSSVPCAVLGPCWFTYFYQFQCEFSKLPVCIEGDKRLLLSIISDNFITKALTSLCWYFQSSFKFIDFPWYWMINFILESGKS